MAPTIGPFVSAATTTAAKNVKVSTPVSTVSFRPHSLKVSTHGQLSCHRVNASGPSLVARSTYLDQYLRTELEKGRVAGPFSIVPIPNLHISRFGIVPMTYQPGKWRLILDFF